MLTHCTNCPRRCGADRTLGAGLCGADALPRVARSALHFYEEPCLSGVGGSGAVFFSGCNLSCLFCQNHQISTQPYGDPCDPARLTKLFLSLQEQGAHNINLVTPTPHLDVVIPAIELARKSGLHLPILYNTNGYETVEALRRLEGLVDIYLPDLKYVTPSLSARCSGAKDYFAFAAPAIAEMQRQVGSLTFDENGMAVRGLLIRHLVLPGYVSETRLVLDHIKAHFPADTWLSLMRQYVPAHLALSQPPFHRRLTKREYDRAVQYCLDLGLTNVYIQEADSADSAFTPDFYPHLPDFDTKSS